jgi:hypothetical protein
MLTDHLLDTAEHASIVFHVIITYHLLLSSSPLPRISTWWHAYQKLKSGTPDSPYSGKSTIIKHDGKCAYTQHGCNCTWAHGRDISRHACTSSSKLIVLSQWKLKWLHLFFNILWFYENKFSNSHVVTWTQQTDGFSNCTKLFTVMWTGWSMQ